MAECSSLEWHCTRRDALSDHAAPMHYIILQIATLTYERSVNVVPVVRDLLSLPSILRIIVFTTSHYQFIYMPYFSCLADLAGSSPTDIDANDFISVNRAVIPLSARNRRRWMRDLR